MRTFLLFCLVCLSLQSVSSARPVKGIAAPTPRALFVFGDSYADTGNGARTAPGFRTPYGITWPGTPTTGRYSDGYVKTDVLASEALHVPTPPAYSQLTSGTSLSGGVNYAVAGSGASKAYGAPPFQTQVGWFADMVSKGAFTADALKNSVVFVSVAGNYYSAYEGALEGLTDVVREVTTKMDAGFRQLYSLGVRNFMVSSLPALSCTPVRTFPSQFSACEKNSSVDGLVLGHNLLLEKKLENITKDLKDADILYLQQTKAMTQIIQNPSKFGLTEGLKPCCLGFCGQVNATTGAPLYQVCSNPDQHMFWENQHPTQAAWKAVVNLYSTHAGYTQFSPSLKKWICSLSS